MTIQPVTSNSNSNNHNHNPYHVLGIPKTASQKEIQKQYRQLCLKYHPDKNLNKSTREKKRAELQFKSIQHAYSLIGDEDARHTYDTQQRFGGFGDGTTTSTSQSSDNNRYYSQSSPLGSDPVAEAFFRAFQQQGAAAASSGRSGFYFFTGPNGANSRFGVRQPFGNTANNPTSQYFSSSDVSYKSIYVQKVTVPLEELYRGVEWRFHLKDNVWTRLRAAIRGRVIYLSIYQGICYALPVLRTSRILALTVGMCIAYAYMPKPDPHHVYKTHIRRGSKGGTTKVKFTSTTFGQPEVIFEIVEKPHAFYKRIGNHLHTTLQVTPLEAQMGCIKQIPPLDEKEPPLVIKVPPNSDSGTTIRLVGKGWPIRNAPDVWHFGDAIIKLKVTKNKKNSNNKKTTKKQSS